MGNVELFELCENNSKSAMFSMSTYLLIESESRQHFHKRRLDAQSTALEERRLATVGPEAATPTRPTGQGALPLVKGIVAETNGRKFQTHAEPSGSSTGMSHRWSCTSATKIGSHTATYREYWRCLHGSGGIHQDGEAAMGNAAAVRARTRPPV